MKNKILIASGALILLSSFVFAPVRRVAAAVQQSGLDIVNSIIDATPIGLHIPAEGHFAFTQPATGGAPSVLPNQGSYIGWNRNVLGETDFFTAPGSGAGGFAWFNGFTPTQIMSLNQSGVLSVNQVNANLVGNVTGNVTGNASTATALATAPTPCSSGKYAGGVDVSGNSTGCSPLWLMASTSSVTATGSGAATTGSATITWPGPGFSGGTYMTVCSGTNPTGSPQQISVVSQTGSTVRVQFQNGTASQAVVSTYGTITCWGQQ